MWCFEYPQDIIMKELNLGSHHTATKWLRRFQKAAVAYMQDKIVFSDIHKELYKKPAGCNANLQKKPAGALSPNSQIRPKCKKPTSNSPVLRRPAAVKKFVLKKKPAASTLPAARTNKIVVQMDESFLNKSKPGALSKAARPKKDQVRVQGFVVSGHPEYFFYTVLQHPEDCIDGKPRGKGEVLKNLNRVGLQKNTILVSDGWKGTVAAVKQYRRDHGLTAAQFPHEIVVHSRGEIKNAKGFTTNAIESRWSVLKRWLRRKCSGRLPIHSDRGAWDMLLGEFTYRKFAQSTQRTRSRVRPGMVELHVQVEHFLTAMREYTWGARGRVPPGRASALSKRGGNAFLGEAIAGRGNCPKRRRRVGMRRLVRARLCDRGNRRIAGPPKCRVTLCSYARRWRWRKQLPAKEHALKT